MDPAAVAGLCAMLAQGHGTPPPGVACPEPVVAAMSAPLAAITSRVASAADRDAIARVTYAEAGNQGDSGLAAVVYTILNRLADGRWGGSVDSVLNARSQFEPVMRAGGDWRRLPPVSAAQQARIDTILNLALDGRLPDLTNGARFFQNPQIVATRARAGEVSPRLVDFGGATPTAVIGAHSFYAGSAEGRSQLAAAPASDSAPSGRAALFVGENRASATDVTAPAAALSPTGAAQGGLFVTRDGVVSNEAR